MAEFTNNNDPWLHGPTSIQPHASGCFITWPCVCGRSVTWSCMPSSQSSDQVTGDQGTILQREPPSQLQQHQDDGFFDCTTHPSTFPLEVETGMSGAALEQGAGPSRSSDGATFSHLSSTVNDYTGNFVMQGYMSQEPESIADDGLNSFTLSLFQDALTGTLGEATRLTKPKPKPLLPAAPRDRPSTTDWANNGNTDPEPQRYHCTRFEGCNASYTKKSSLARHEMKVHLNRPRFRCFHEGCSADFKWHDGLSKHVRKKHSG